MLRALSAYLTAVVSNAAVNKMSVRNVGIVFAPTLNIPAPLLAAFITDHDAIFGHDPHDPAGAAPAALRTQEVVVPTIEAAPLTPEDIRSPRHQAFSDLPTPAYHQDTFPRAGFAAPPPASERREPSRGRREPSTGGSRDPGARRAPAPPPQQPGSLAGSLAGFVPLQPSYELPPGFAPAPAPRENGAAPGERAEKAKRRESAMLGVGSLGAHRKSSFNGLRPQNGACFVRGGDE